MLKDKSALGQTGLEVSPLCLGCGSYGGSMKEPLAVEMMDYYYELGGRFLDTAVIYCALHRRTSSDVGCRPGKTGRNWCCP